MLKPGGLLAISVPNADSWQARLFGGQWLHLDPPRHLNLFNPDNLSRLLRTHAFEPVLVVRNPLEFGPIGYVQSTMNALGIRRDAFFEILKTKGETGQAVSVETAALVWLAAMLTPPAAALSLIEAAAGASATFELYARKPPEATRPAPRPGQERDRTAATADAATEGISGPSSPS